MIAASRRAFRVCARGSSERFVRFGMGYSSRGLTPARGALLCLRTAMLALAGGIGTVAPAWAAQTDQQPATSPAATSSSPAAASSQKPGAQPAQKPGAAPAQKPAQLQHFDIDDFAVQGVE